MKSYPNKISLDEKMKAKSVKERMNKLLSKINPFILHINRLRVGYNRTQGKIYAYSWYNNKNI